MNEGKNEEEKPEKYTSRKWAVTVWAMVMASTGLLSCAAATFLGKNISGGFMGAVTTLCAVPIAYIGGNVCQKVLTPKNECER